MKLLKRTLIIMLALLSVLSLFSCSKSKDKTIVLKGGGEKISSDVYEYFYKNYLVTETEATKEQLHKLTLDAIASDIAITLLAKEYDISLTDDENTALDDYINGLIDEKGGEEEYNKYLEESFLTPELFRHLYAQKQLETKLREYMENEYNNVFPSDDTTFEKDLKKNFAAAKQILILKDTDNAKELADELYSRIEKGEDFDALMVEYNQDEALDTTYGRYFTKGMMVSEFEEAVFSLKENRVYNGVVESSVGYHIIWRLPLDKGYIDDNYETLRYYYKTRCINEILAEKAESIEFKKTKKFDLMDLG